MKIIKESASNREVENAKHAFDSANDDEEKLETLRDFLTSPEVGLEEEAFEVIKKFGIQFLTSWMNSFKWEEAGRGQDNELIAAMNWAVDNKAFEFDTISDFVKFYNVYADDLIDDFNINDDSNILNPIFHFTLYNFSEDDVKEIMKLYNNCKSSNKISNEDIKNIFYESDAENKAGVVNSLATIRGKLKKIDNSITRNDEYSLKKLLKDENNRRYADTIIKQYEADNIQQE